MNTKHLLIYASTIVLTLGVITAFYLPSRADEPGGRLEYKVVPATKLGIDERHDGAVFNYPEMEKTLNEFAAEGWEWHEYVTVKTLGAVILVRGR